MPSSSRDDDQPRRRRKDYDRDRDRDRDSTLSASTKDKPHRSSHKKSHKRRSGSKERDRDRDSNKSTLSDRSSKKGSVMVPEMDRRPSSGGDVKSRTSYPTFSKAHSREAVGSREDVGSTKSRPYTPDTTDQGEDTDAKRHSTPPTRPPPSPPLSAEKEVRRSGSGASIRRAADVAKDDMSNGRKSADSTPRATAAKNSKSNASLRHDARFGESEVSSMPGAFPEEDRKSSPTSGYRRTESTGSQPASNISQTTITDSDATSVAADRKPKRAPNNKSKEQSPPSVIDVHSKTPVSQEQQYPPYSKTPVIEVGGGRAYSPQPWGQDHRAPMPPPPPPPPPPVSGSQSAPRVDYLMKHGGLPSLIPRRLVQTGTSASVQQYSHYQSPGLAQMAPTEEYARLFGGLHKRLDDYLHVLRHSGSMAVATGYRSVARRLLDKLSQVFARDISSERCDCVVCKTFPPPTLSDEEDSGVSWGEILEFVSGRSMLPQWPPFTIQPEDGGLGIQGATQAPMQKLDIDVPEEYKDHYIRQNQKTKKAVQSWLSQQPDDPASPPEEADEDTLMFAMMTKLDTPQRNMFLALMHGQQQVSQSRAPTPAERPTTSSNALKRARKALQRLYRLDRPPRDCESAMYLLHNPALHGMLATLAEVHEQEWDILVSGRFDGFLWSGAEAQFASGYGTPAPSRGPSRTTNGTPFSRNTTPFSGMSSAAPSRTTTPFSPLRNVMSSDTLPSRGPTPLNGAVGGGLAPPAPVQLDEDTEIAVLAEVERNLFTDMERFEDAFEVLHSRAELVRQMLRERSAGLSMQAQARRGSGASEIGARMGTPASGVTDFEEGDDDGLADMVSLAPDDSASQISVNRRQRKRHERRTPAPVAEEDESAYEVPPPRDRHGGRRSKH